MLKQPWLSSVNISDQNKDVTIFVNKTQNTLR